MHLPQFPFVVLDTETTGLTPRSDKIIELAIVRFEGGEKIAEYESLYEVGRELPELVQVLTRIRPADLEGKSGFDPSTIAPLLGGAVLVGHNIPFDMSMLQGEGVELDNVPFLDTAMLASIVFPECKSYSLPYLSTVLGLTHEPRHRAMGDVKATLDLFAKCWERLQELPVAPLKDIAERGPEGYAALFSEVKEGGKRTLSMPTASSPTSLSSLLSHAQGGGQRCWLAVKNLHTALRSLSKQERSTLSVIHAPYFLLDQQAGQALLSQEHFASYELTLAFKLLLYSPIIQWDLPIHAEERDVWKGKLSCTWESPLYREQLEQAGSTVLIDHRQLLELIARGDGPKKGDRIVIDDASMLEDTATKAFRWSCSIDPLRAAAEGNSALTSLLDAYQIWVEKVRSSQDVRYLVETDLTALDARGLSDRVREVLSGELTQQVRERLEDLQKILDPKSLSGRIAFIEQFRDGGQIVQSVPENIAGLLQEQLYDCFPTTLLLPPGGGLSAIIPSQADVECQEDSIEGVPLLFADEHLTLDRLLGMIDGKVIALVGSRRMIEQLYVKYTIPLEEKGITLIAQGLSGGLGRMQAEFHAAEGPAVWLLTPWMYEGVELPKGTVDHLWITTLPFDHPSHSVLSRRADRLGRAAFDEYYIPRLLHRLFRVLRTFMQHNKEDANVIVLDERVRTKQYGKRVMEYLRGITATSPSPIIPGGSPQ